MKLFNLYIGKFLILGNIIKSTSNTKYDLSLKIYIPIYFNF